jgi:GTP-binding protein
MLDVQPTVPAPPILRRPTPCIALVGRPNVGKSTVFNRLIGKRTALVMDEPHVTRDRLYGVMRANDKIFQVIDTGGLLGGEPARGGPPIGQQDVYTHVHAQTLLAIEAAELVLLVVDARVGPTPGDAEIAQALRRAGKAVAVLANKVDTQAQEDLAHAFYTLGFDTVLPISAEHARGFDAVADLVCELCDPPDADDSAAPDVRRSRGAPQRQEQNVSELLQAGEVDPSEVPELLATLPSEPSRVHWDGEPICVAVVGRPNAGKSSLINRLLGEERHLACATPGATRDAVDSELTMFGQSFVFIDTAGVRRKRSIERKLEQFAVVAAFNSMDRCDVAVMLLDGTVRPTDQDARIAAMAHDKGKGLILAVNKWEMVENPQWQEEYLLALRKELPFADYAPIVTLSAKTGDNVETLCKEVVAAQQERHRRVTTGELNRFFREVVASHPPPRQGGKRPQLYFVSQPLIRPPTFVFASNRMDRVHFSYARYLQNALRQRYGFGGTPLWLKFRQRSSKPK